MIAYLKESIVVSNNQKRLLDAMKENEDILYDIFLDGSFAKNSYFLDLPDGKPGVWFQRKVTTKDGGKADILVYTYSLRHGENCENIWRSLRIRVWMKNGTNVSNRSVVIGEDVVDVKGRRHYPDEFRKTLKATKALRDMVKKLSAMDSLKKILKTIEGIK